jgi:hypothetical protein
MAESQAPSGVAADNRREWIRIDDRLLFEYRLMGDNGDRALPARAAVTEEMIAAAVEKPTAELLARSGDVLTNAALVPWIMKVDWLIEVILKTLAKAHPGSIDLARVTNVNISGGGIGFESPGQLQAGDRLALKLILPPFTPIHAVAKVLRSAPAPGGGGFIVAAEFVEMSADDQEHLIRHILQVQAERLRARRRLIS